MRAPIAFLVAVWTGLLPPAVHQFVVPRSTNAVTVTTLTVQEAIFPGSTTGVARTSEPFSAGIPLADSATTGATTISQLSLTGASVGQFRILGRWPSNRIKWVQVDSLASMSAAGADTSLSLTRRGASTGGNFGGADMGVDNGTTIVVTTGAATFTIQKANFDGFHQVDVGASTVVTSGSSVGLVVYGPAFNATTCSGGCTTAYTLANDGSSTCTIEENGPLRVAVKCTGDLKDGSGNAYLGATVRMQFYKSKSYVRAGVALRNATYGASSSFASAYKNFEAFEWRVSLNLSGTTDYAFGTHSTDATGTLTTTDDAYVYQGKTTLLQNTEAGYPVDFTATTGYSVVKNGSPTHSGTTDQLSGGWGNVQTAAGLGLLVGHYLPGGHYPKGVSFDDTGTLTRVGIWPAENSETFWANWPQQVTQEVFFYFHASALSSNSNEFLKLQHKLLARAPLSYYNTTGVFPTPFLDSTTEDAYYATVQAAASPSITAPNGCCISDLGTSDTAHWPLKVYRNYTWSAGGPLNQPDRHWSQLIQWLIRGMPGRYLDAAHFYRYVTDQAFARSDGFTWGSKVPGVEYGAAGEPLATSTNEGSWWHAREEELLHEHWYGLADYYFMSGDEFTRDFFTDDMKDHFVSTGIYAQTGRLAATRAVANHMLLATRFAIALAAMGESTFASDMSTLGQTIFEKQVKSDLCVNDTPTAMTSCNPGFDPSSIGTWTDGTSVTPASKDATSRTRGVHQPDGQTSTEVCGTNIRVANAFMTSIMAHALLEYSDYRGTSWSDYWLARDLLDGAIRFRDNELFKYTTGARDVDGIRPGLCLDIANVAEPNWTTPTAGGTFAPAFYANWALNGTTSSWEPKFKVALQRVMGTSDSVTFVDHSSAYVNAVIYRLVNPGTTSLQDVTITGVTDNGGGSYTLQWTVPTGAQSYRVKYSNKTIVTWLNFNPSDLTFGIDPATNAPWFAATNAASIPSPATAGTTQSFTFSTGLGTGLTSPNFSVKAYVTP